MTIYLTETDLVRELADQFRRAANSADEIADDVAAAIALSELESMAARDAIVLSESLDDAAATLRTQSHEFDDLDRSPVVSTSSIRDFREPGSLVTANP